MHGEAKEWCYFILSCGEGSDKHLARTTRRWGLRGGQAIETGLFNGAVIAEL